MQTGFVQQQPSQFGQQPQQQFQPGQQAPQQQFLGQGMQGGFGAGGLVAQPTGFPGQQQQRQFIPPQPTGFPALQAQPTGFGGFQQRAPPPPPPLPTQPTGFGGLQPRAPPPPPPVPPLPSQFQGQQTTMLQPQTPNRFLSSSPSLMPQQTGFPAASPLVAQPTGFVDPRLQMFTTSFMAAPSGPPQLNLVQSFQQHNQDVRGQTTQQMGWALSRAEKKKYDGIFRSWDSRGTGFIEGQTALELFGASGLPQNELAQIW